MFNRFFDKVLLYSKKLFEHCNSFQDLLKQSEPILDYNGRAVSPNNLIPFYESFVQGYYQCFY